MKTKGAYTGWSAFFFLLTLVLALFSWMGSIYGVGEVQSLLGVEGVRWLLGHVVSNYVQTPALGVVLILLMGMGVVARSGMWDALKRFCRPGRLLSSKERRALAVSIGLLVGYILLVLVTVLMPWNIGQSVVGSWLHSPFAKGVVYVFSLGVGLSGMVYGFASDSFRHWSEVLDAMSSLIIRHASYFVALFFISQFFEALVYVRMDEWLGVGSHILSIIVHFVSYLPLFFHANSTLSRFIRSSLRAHA